MREIYPICDETSYKKALEEMEPLFDNPPAPNSEDEIWLDSMVTLVEAYEKKKYPLDGAYPTDRKISFASR